jgi:hypothetical protein
MLKRAHLHVSGRSHWDIVDDDFFQINYQEDAKAAGSRFKTWLEPRLTSALNLWRQTL